jgi:hypothetical protein
MNDSVLSLKLVLGVVGTAAALALHRWPALFALSDRWFTGLVLVFVAVSRLGMFALLYLVVGLDVPADVNWYYPIAAEALNGGVVGRDFESEYGPLFCYVLAGALAVWHSTKAFVLVAIFLELLSLPLWLSVARQFFSERTARLASLLYLTNPVVFVISVVGQQQIWISFHLAAAFWLLARGKDLASGLVTGLMLLTTKILSLLFAPMLALGSRNRAAWVVGFFLLPVGVYGALVLAGGRFWGPLAAAIGTTSGNLPYLLTLFGLDNRGATGTLCMAVLLLALTVIFLAAATRGVARHPPRLIYLTVLVFLTYATLSRMAWTNYQAMCMFPLCLMIVADRLGWRAVLAFGLFGLLSVLEPSLSFRWAHRSDLSVLWRPVPAGGPERWRVALLALWDAALLAFYAAYWWRSFRLAFDGLQHQPATGPA